MTVASPSPFAAWLALPEGHRFAPMAGTLTPAAQARQHAATDVAPALFADRIDPTLLGQDMVLLASRNGLPVDGRVHAAHAIRQHRPLGWDRAYRVEGRIDRLAPAAQGHAVEMVVDAMAEGDATPAITLSARYLLPLPVPRQAAGPPRPSAAAPPDVAPVPPPASAIGTLELAPDRVKSYSADVGNLLHFDPAFAARRGYRAPIAQGLMVVTASLGRIAAAEGAVPARFALTARFRRPAFWGDRLTFRVAGESWRAQAEDDRILVDGGMAIDRA